MLGEHRLYKPSKRDKIITRQNHQECIQKNSKEDCQTKKGND